MNFLHCLRHLLRHGHDDTLVKQAEEVKGALRGLLDTQMERTEAARAAKDAARGNVRAYAAEKTRIQARTEAQAKKGGQGTTSYAREQVENLLSDLDRDVARVARGDAEEG